jgi:hypothetical protein
MVSPPYLEVIDLGCGSTMEQNREPSNAKVSFRQGGLSK